MNGRLFALVNPINPDEALGWGVEITRSDEREAVVFFREPGSRQVSFGVHDSADAAWRSWARDEPLCLVWPS
ncbi:hypothetical protein [Actinophytocola sediminis]